MSRELIYACRPMERLLRGDCPQVVESSPEIREAARSKWASLLE